MRIAGDVDANLVDELHKVLAGKTERVVLRNTLKLYLEDLIRNEG